MLAGAWRTGRGGAAHSGSRRPVGGRLDFFQWDRDEAVLIAGAHAEQIADLDLFERHVGLGAVGGDGDHLGRDIPQLVDRRRLPHDENGPIGCDGDTVGVEAMVGMGVVEVVAGTIALLLRRHKLAAWLLCPASAALALVAAPPDSNAWGLPSFNGEGALRGVIPWRRLGWRRSEAVPKGLPIPFQPRIGGRHRKLSIVPRKGTQHTSRR